MSNKPKISVIIPSYNCGRFVADAVTSVLTQSFRDFELVIVDDGSTDDTKQVLAPFLERIRYIFQDNRGLAGALNTGIRATKGELLAILDADDLWEPDKLAEQVTLFEEHSDIGLCYTNFLPFGAATDYLTGFDEQGGSLVSYATRPLGLHAFRIVSESFLEDLLVRQGTPKPSTVIFRRSCLDKVGLFDEALTFCQDTHMWLRMAKYFSFAYLDRCLTRRRIRSDSLASSQSDQRYLLEHIYMISSLENWIPLTEKEKRAAQKLLAGYYLAAGYGDFNDLELISSRQYLLKSLKAYFNLKALVYLSMTYCHPRGLKTLRWLKQQLGRNRRHLLTSQRR